MSDTTTPPDVPAVHEGGMPQDFEGISITEAAELMVKLSGGTAEPEAPPAPAPVAPPVEAAPPAAAPDPLEVRIAEYVARQAAERRELETERNNISAHKSEAEKLRAELDSLKSKLKTAPLEVLHAEGWDIEALNRSVLTERTPESVRLAQIEERFRQLESRVVAERAAAEAAATEANTSRAVEYTKATIQTTVESGAFPHISAFLEPHEYRQAVYDIMAHRYGSSNGTQRYTPAEAAGLLESQLSARAMRLTATKPPAPVASAAPPTARPTLTNASTAATPSPLGFDDLSVPDAELNRRAALLIDAKSRK